MDDATFEEIRDALSPGRDKTSRLGALYLLEISYDGDDRIGPLLATLMRERTADVLAACAALAHKFDDLRRMLDRDLNRLWSVGLPEYRACLLQALDPNGLARMAMQYAATTDELLKFGLLARLQEIPDVVTRRDAALYLSRDTSAAIRAKAMHTLAGIAQSETQSEEARLSTLAPGTPTPAVRAAAMRLAGDPDPDVRVAAMRGLASACAPEEAREQLQKLAADPDMEVREAAANLQRDVQQRITAETVAAYVAKQAELVNAGEFNKAMAVAAQVFMRVANHGGCQYQMARAAAGLGDVRRSLHLLANAFQAGFRDLAAVDSDPLFDAARATDAWPEVMAMAERPEPSENPAPTATQ
jgi:hypothetical protein